VAPEFVSQGGPLQVIAILVIVVMVALIGMILGYEVVKRDRARRGL